MDKTRLMVVIVCFMVIVLPFLLCGIGFLFVKKDKSLYKEIRRKRLILSKREQSIKNAVKKALEEKEAEDYNRWHWWVA